MSTEQLSLRESVPCGPKLRLLFCSYHCYWDPSSGAALCTRHVLELLSQRGWACRVFCGPRFDFEERPALAQFLGAQRIRFEQCQTTAGAVPLSVFHFRQGGVPIMIYDSPVARPFQTPSREEGLCF